MTQFARSHRATASSPTFPCSNSHKKSWFRRALTSSSQRMNLLPQSLPSQFYPLFTDTLVTTWIVETFNRPFTLIWTKGGCGTSAAMCWTMTSITTAWFPCTNFSWIPLHWEFGFIQETLTPCSLPRAQWIGSLASAAQLSKNGSRGQVHLSLQLIHFHNLSSHVCHLVIFFVFTLTFLCQPPISSLVATLWSMIEWRLPLFTARATSCRESAPGMHLILYQLFWSEAAWLPDHLFCMLDFRNPCK